MISAIFWKVHIMAFDKSKPYGTIGGIFGIARFEQDGKYYDAQFNELDNEGNPKKRAPKAEKEPKEAKEPAKEVDELSADDQLAKNLG